MEDKEIWDCQDCGGYSYDSKEDVYHFSFCMWSEIPEVWLATHYVEA